MKRHKIIALLISPIIILFTVFILFGLAYDIWDSVTYTNGEKNFDNAKKVQEGMSSQEVLVIMGNPMSKDDGGCFVYENVDGASGSIYFCFDDLNKVDYIIMNDK